MREIGERARQLPAPPRVVWASLAGPRRPWLRLLADEVEPVVLAAEEPRLVVWSSLWPSRPDDQVRIELTATTGGATVLRFVLRTPSEVPDPSKLGHLRRRLNTILFADLRFSYGQ
ncbi:hypothetical protein F5X71_26535 [Nocardia brasiliensis]|uniref:SRPBCC family protein n=1 Tax=Nocardia brasiliensis TaxID=37326 RepID=A0A6G9XX06_NOCBR|nr:hypothetical protein [Nocardia brasiliensis]QIS05397.1 hypothetical protein F5X71_26535 [Nocardia brasiliensis]